MGMSQSSITAYECGVREPSFEIVRRFAEYFNVAPSALMPFGEVSDHEYVQRVAESLHQNPKLKMLFDRTKNFGEKDLDAMIAIADSIAVRRE
jgi:transcriptional regulator with XRE-family HTH domain